MKSVLFLCALSATAWAQNAFVRVNQVGYESSAQGPFRAYLMSTTSEEGATFRVLSSQGSVVFQAPIGASLGTWSHSSTLTYLVYALDFRVPPGESFSIHVSGPIPTASPAFAVSDPATLYSGLLLNSLFFYETERDGADYVPNALRTAPGHLNDSQATVYLSPPMDENDEIATTGAPLTSTGAVIDGSGGWWDAGDYMKYVQTTSYALALQEIGIRDFPQQMGPAAPVHPSAPPNALSYSGNAAGSPLSSDFSAEAQFGMDFLMKMWDDSSKTLYYQVGNSQDWANFPNLISDYDIWRLPQADDTWDGCAGGNTYICYRPVFVAAPAGSKISPNLAGRLAADFALWSQLNRAVNPQLADQSLKIAEDIFALADTSFSDPAASVGSGTCTSGCLTTILPFDGYPETVWDDDMELGATELYLALHAAQSAGSSPAGLPEANPQSYLAKAAQFAENYISRVYNPGYSDALNLYDVSGLAHFELYRALGVAGNPQGMGITQKAIGEQLRKQVGLAISQAQSDPWGFGSDWTNDTTSHGAGISVMASEAREISGVSGYDVYSQRWLGNILGANAWGSSFIVGDGSATFANCIQHQVANLAGALNGTSGGAPVLWGASTEGPSYSASFGALDGMILCPADGSNHFKSFDGNAGAFGAGSYAVYKDNVQSYTTTEPAIDLTASSMLMWSWRIAVHPAPLN